MVSPWAARCTACGRRTDDAQGPGPGEVFPNEEAASAGAPAGAPTAPANAVESPFLIPEGSEADPIPEGSEAASRKGGWSRLVAVVAGAVGAGAVVAGAAVGVIVLTSGGGALPGGEIVSAPSAGVIVLTTTTGRVTASIPAVQGTGLLLAADGRYLATGTGQEYALRGRTLAPTGRDIPFNGPPGSWRAVDFTDHDMGLVATDSSSSGFGGVEAVTFAGHRTSDLGPAESVVGDPDALGVFAVFADPGTGPGSEGANPLADTRIERRDAGAAPVVLAGADQLAEDLGEKPGTAILSVLPDPQGDRIAVLVVPAGAQPQRAGIVVLSRNGRLLGVTRLTDQGGGPPAWSPNGRSLVYDASTPAHAAVAVWRMGRKPSVRNLPPPKPTAAAAVPPAPATFTGLGRCLWAVAGTGFLCSDSQIGETSTVWLIGRTGGGSLVRVVGPSVPLAWLPVSGTAAQ
jgi:hypothetical protein